MPYRVTRTETITYTRDFTLDEMLALGVPREVFTDGDLTADFMDFVSSSAGLDAAEALDRETERHGDVLGATYKIATVK